jgi:hypothetical protein
MIARAIKYFGKDAVLICDGKCNKAWGINLRPKSSLSDDPDDVVYHRDDMLGNAPIDPGTYEGGHAKPQGGGAARLNKWCARECERSAVAWTLEEFEIPNYSVCVVNMLR